MYAYVVPQAPAIIKVSNNGGGNDIITYQPVAYAKTYELYRKRIGIDNEYQLCEEFLDNKSHSLTMVHSDKDIIYSYKLCAKAAEAIDVCTNERYYPTSDFSNEMSGIYHEEESSSDKGSSEESSSDKGSSEEESSSIEESSEEENSSEEESRPIDSDIRDGLSIVGLKDKIYTGSAIKQSIKLYYNKVPLTEGIDYTLAYKNNIKAGTAHLIIKAKGNLTGSVIKNFEIKPREITDENVIVEDAVYTFNNKMHKRVPTVAFNGKKLKEGKDYIVTDFGQGDYIAVGTYIIKIKGIGNFKGNIDNIKVIITDQARNIAKATVAKIPAQQYISGKTVELPDHLIKVTLAKCELRKDIDYIVSYANNNKPGKATLIIKGVGAYAGTKKYTFTIKQTPVAITESMVENKNSIAKTEIVKGGATPEPILIANGYTLQKDTDYTVRYKNNNKAGVNALMIIKGKGTFKGSITVPFMVTTKSINSPDLTIRVPDVPYTENVKKYKSKPVIMDKDGKLLILNKDYTIESYHVNSAVKDQRSISDNNTKITISIQGKGNYTGIATQTYEVRGARFSSASIKVSAKTYTGKAVTIGPKDIISASIKIGKIKKELVYGVDYEISCYENNVKKGSAVVIFKGKGDYAGEKAVKFKIKSSRITE